MSYLKAVFYLSTNNNTYDLTMDISNIKYTVTAAGKSAGNKPAKEYPTNIFTVADTKIADFDEKGQKVKLSVLFVTNFSLSIQQVHQPV